MSAGIQKSLIRFPDRWVRIALPCRIASSIKYPLSSIPSTAQLLSSTNADGAWISTPRQLIHSSKGIRAVVRTAFHIEVSISVNLLVVRQWARRSLGVGFLSSLWIH